MGHPQLAEGRKRVARELLILVEWYCGESGSESEAQLPVSMKGYDLFAWKEGADFAYALMTGTNRQKTVEEIISAESPIDEQGLVVVRGSGIASLRGAIERVPAGTEVILVELSGLPPLDAGRRDEVEAVVALAR